MGIGKFLEGRASSLTLSVNGPLQFHINNMSNSMLKSQGVVVSPFVSEFTVQVLFEILVWVQKMSQQLKTVHLLSFTAHTPITVYSKSLSFSQDGILRCRATQDDYNFVLKNGNVSKMGSAPNENEPLVLIHE